MIAGAAPDTGTGRRLQKVGAAKQTIAAETKERYGIVKQSVFSGFECAHDDESYRRGRQ